MHDRRVWETRDPDGRRVRLAEEAWLHIVERHPELVEHRGDIMSGVSEPDVRVAGRLAHEEWFYRSGIGPSRWLKVVVHYEGRNGVVITAFPRRSVP